MSVASQNFVFIHIWITIRFSKKQATYIFFTCFKNKICIDCAVFHKANVLIFFSLLLNLKELVQHDNLYKSQIDLNVYAF